MKVKILNRHTKVKYWIHSLSVLDPQCEISNERDKISIWNMHFKQLKNRMSLFTIQQLDIFCYQRN